jgi:hypothetical protein
MQGPAVLLPFHDDCADVVVVPHDDASPFFRFCFTSLNVSGMWSELWVNFCG